MENIVKITLHGDLGEKLGKEWKLAVESVGEAINAIETLSGGKLYKFLQTQEQFNAPYRVLINNEDFVSEEKLDNLEKVENVKNSNLILKHKNLKTIDIIPVLEGASSILNVVLGALLIIIGIVISVISYGAASAAGVALIGIGVGLLATGIIGLLMKPPEASDFAGGAKGSYLFSGPQNITQEGGPVPMGYGRLLIGSQVISASYNIYDANSETLVINDSVTSNGGVDGATVQANGGEARTVPLVP